MDRILIRTPHVEKINGRTFQIQPDGFVTLPSVGRVRAAGLEVSSLEKTLAGRLRLKPKTSGDPDVVILVTTSSNK
jgi:protein involved in polysaccharide export with SLBB domain